MARARRRIAILGGGMGGLAAAWRLSEPGWRDDIESITVYQRGHRLGGKGASSRAEHGRIEEHGLHIWLGYYENAFRLLRECYAELDRPATDPGAPIRTWRDAMIPASEVGLEDLHGDEWRHWLGRFAPNDLLPGEPDGEVPDLTVVEFARRALRLIADFLESLPAGASIPGELTFTTAEQPAMAPNPLVAGAGVAALAAVLEASSLTSEVIDRSGERPALAALDRVIAALSRDIGAAASTDPDLRRTWHLVSVMAGVIRGIVAEGLLTDPRGFQAINDEDFVDWIVRHGAVPEVADFAFMRGLYDLVFGYAGADPERRGFGAGLAVFLTGKMLFQYKGAIFWKMAAGMGDIVFAPLYEALRARGVTFELFHRVDALHLSPDRTLVESISIGRQVRLARDVERYEPLIRVKGLPCFPDRALVDQLRDADGIECHDLESHWCEWPDAEQRVLRRGEDFDTVVLAMPVAMSSVICRELIDDSPAWRDMVDNVATVATQSFQIWMREDEPALGWRWPGTTVSAYVEPFSTWASMPQLIPVEDWPDDDRPRSIAYFCGALDAPWPPNVDGPAFKQQHDDAVRDRAARFVASHLAQLLPEAGRGEGFRWDLLCGSGGRAGADAFASQFWVANVDPSDRYVQSLPGTDRYRLRSDESGYDNLFLAGDWTDCGLNAGCIESAVLSGLEAANAILGRPRTHRIAGFILP